MARKNQTVGSRRVELPETSTIYIQTKHLSLVINMCIQKKDLSLVINKLLKWFLENYLYTEYTELSLSLARNKRVYLYDLGYRYIGVTVKKFHAWSHWENYISISSHIEWDMIVVTVFLSILNQMEFHLVQNRMENCHHDHTPFNVEG